MDMLRDYDGPSPKIAAIATAHKMFNKGRGK
jgi:hypothetical protein